MDQPKLNPKYPLYIHLSQKGRNKYTIIKIFVKCEIKMSSSYLL